MPDAKLTLRERRKRRDRLGIIMVTVSTIVIVSVFVLANVFETAARDSNLCIEGETPKAYHIVLVDKTDLVGQNFSKEIKKFIINKAQAIGMDEMLEVYAIRGTFDKRFPPQVSLCNPGRGKQYNELFHNQAKKERVYQNEYIKQITASVEKVVAAEQWDQSPILEVLDDLTTRPKYMEQVPKTIILISDMAQNTAQLRFVQDRMPYMISDAAIRDAIQAIAGTQGLRFHDFGFQVYQIQKAYSQRVIDHVKTIWTKIIQDAGGELVYWGSL